MSEHLPEGSAEAGIAPVEVDPLGETESQNHVILWTHCLHLWLRLWHIVLLLGWEREREGGGGGGEYGRCLLGTLKVVPPHHKLCLLPL